MLANAMRICEAKFDQMYLRDGDAFRTVATHNAPPAYVEARSRDLLLRPPPDMPLGRVVITKQAVQIADITTTRSYIERHPFVVSAVDLGGFRTVLRRPNAQGERAPDRDTPARMLGSRLDLRRTAFAARSDIVFRWLSVREQPRKLGRR
jgi:hypothetical protein